MAISSVLNRFGLGDADTGDAEHGGQAMVMALVFSLSVLAAIALLLVWLNIERTKLAYTACNLQREVEAAQELNGKLIIERESLLRHGRLGDKADQLGLGPAKPGQIRRME